MKYFIAFFFLVSYSQAFSQETNPRTFKLGLEPFYFFNLQNNFGLRVETERAFQRAKILSNTYSLGWLYRPVSTSVHDIFFVHYLVKVYPLGTLFSRNSLQGIYIGLGPGAYAENLNYKSYRQGIAVFLNTGWQFDISQRLSLSFELEAIWTTDFNNAATWNTHGNYLFYFANTLKFGWNFQGNSYRNVK